MTAEADLRPLVKIVSTGSLSAGAAIQSLQPVRPQLAALLPFENF